LYCGNTLRYDTHVIKDPWQRLCALKKTYKRDLQKRTTKKTHLKDFEVSKDVKRDPPQRGGETLLKELGVD